MKLSEKIYTYRKQSGKSQEQLAELMGVSRQAVSKWETGEADPESGKLLQLADCMGVSVDWLLSSEKGMPPVPSDRPPAAKGSGGKGRVFSRISWDYPLYVIGLLLLVLLLITTSPRLYPSFSIHVDLSNLINFFLPDALFAIVVCCALLLLGSGLTKPLGQGFQFLLCRKKPLSCSRSRRAVHTVMAGCMLGSGLYTVADMINLMKGMDLSITSSPSIWGFLSLAILLPLFYGILAVLLLLPVSLRLREQE